MPVRPGDPQEQNRSPRRADAARNRERILLAAREVFVEQGPAAPLDDIVKRAGVGPATLYRNFPDRAALIRAVAIDIIMSVAAEGSAALAEEPDPFKALARYMHRAIDARIAAVMPVLIPNIDTDAEFLAVRDAAVEPVTGIIAAAHESEQLRPDVTFGDIAGLLSRFSRPLLGPLTPETDLAMAHRHLDLVLDGLRTGDSSQSRPALTGPALTSDDFAALGDRWISGRPTGS